MRSWRLKKKALAVSVACALSLGTAQQLDSLAYAAGDESVQTAGEAAGAGGSEPVQATQKTAPDSKAAPAAGEAAKTPEGGQAKAAAGDAAGSDKAGAGEYDLPALTVEAPRPDWESKLSPGTVTVIRPSDYRGEQKSLAELLKTVPGVHVREVNGKGQYTTVSVRGSTAAQVGVFVDGVLFTLGGDAAADISTIPIKNVERIEVYRGYIPARFGGTFMGGVINIVTKRPTKSDISASVGKSSYGGYKGSLEVDAPLGKGSLMVGVNREQSDGDFPYTNYSSSLAVADLDKDMALMDTTMALWHTQSILKFGSTWTDSVGNTSSGYGILTNAQASYYAANLDAWKTWAYGDDDGDGKTNLYETVYDYYYTKYSGNATKAETKTTKIVNSVDSSTSTDYQGWLKQKAADQAKKDQLGDGTRYRKYNDYKNTDAIIKWQDDHWTAKATWKEIDRHLPNPLTPDSSHNEAYVDAEDTRIINMEKKQKIITKELQLGRRDTVGKLEWGWSVNYLDSTKSYRSYPSVYDSVDYYWKTPFRKWSEFDSQRWGGSIDGTYKAGDRHLLEFLLSYSKESMHVRGSLVTDGTNPDPVRYRTYYTQELWNLQLQDTITLNDTGDLWLTPSIRYNSSTTYGSNPLDYDAQHQWNKEIEQTSGKTTWQLALKKKVNDHLTLRATGGSYYRLLNLYEIAGDGAGILPAPAIYKNGSLVSSFPLPEEGKQWDVTAIWNNRLLGADSNIQLTYFGRNAKNLLQLWRYGYDYWCYSNSAEGRVRGLELQTNLSWAKWDLNLAATYMDTKAKRRDTSATGDNTYYDIHTSYTPDWEGSARLTYRPDNRNSIFGEVKYVGKMYTSYSTYDNDAIESLTTVGLGVKHKFRKDVELVVGVDDLCNAGPKVKGGWNGNYIYNMEYPYQGRTYYTTLQYNF
ncbi:TonB-dependent receptor plug domain-containing protein [Sporomusa acidovorans]|uniref:Vitamin B12 transporter BtuB n=1 Tax=Sporomusa acidovorans (strain ATCC 49682 / DSM 3132 / Mol) TaxID=1123286 RepID=A0ABZ3IYY5_SPOA4|nr:TonB-dependent receptor [Sporomusa acidovorans]OZC17668.1 vitamin B12 transporter BtuB precursor [Sporomusa acidovorans DSM 3132]SDE11496.1 TonB dependent receptor [Sporomusa acidovorans]